MFHQPLTIAIASSQRQWYGGEEHVHLLAGELRNRGHHVHILARHGGALARRMKDDGFSVAEFAGNGRNPLALWQIRRHLRRIHPDVLQFNDSHALTAVGLASWGLTVPARIAMRHVFWSIRAPWRFRAFSDRIVCVSHAVAEVCRGAGLPSDMLRVVFGATDPERACAGNRQQGRLAACIADERPMILVVAGLNENKGHAFLLDAMPAILGRYPSADLALAGDGPQMQPLRLQAKRLEIDDHVRFLGYRRDVPDLLQAADLVVLPSLAEGLPVTLMDAMFAGAPIVTTAVGGIADLTGSNEPQCESVAWVVPSRNGPALAAAILDALDRPQERALRADRARQRAQQMFTADRMTDAFLAVYREILETRQPR